MHIGCHKCDTTEFKVYHSAKSPALTKFETWHKSECFRNNYHTLIEIIS
jgi:hypothetical protein